MILGIHPDEVQHVGVEMIAAVTQRAHRSSVPIAIHWDHGANYERDLTAIHSGFTSVMIDGSMLPFEENIAISRKVVHAVHAVGLSVEAELGTIGKTDSQAKTAATPSSTPIPTTPESLWNRRPWTASLSPSAPPTASTPRALKPELRLDLLKQIKDRVDIPLVLHGGSNNPDDEIAEAVKLGISKINISSDIKVAYHKKMREVLADQSLREPLLIQPPCIEAMKAVAAQKIDLFDTAGKASLY